jgi:hypothetical protein
MSLLVSFKETTVPCQYWYDNKWYDLTSFGSSTNFFTTTHTTADEQFAAYNFC